MPGVIYREAVVEDVPALARNRAAEWESQQYWTRRITGYMEGRLHPQKALAPRLMFVAVEDRIAVGFIAGHLTRRFECDGEREWIDVIAERRRQGIASEMVRILARWFVEQRASRICVDPGNPSARLFYAHLRAENLNRHWRFRPDISAIAKATSAGAAPSEC